MAEIASEWLPGLIQLNCIPCPVPRCCRGDRPPNRRNAGLWRFTRTLPVPFGIAAQNRSLLARVLPLFNEQDIVSRVLTNRGSEYCGSPRFHQVAPRKKLGQTTEALQTGLDYSVRDYNTA
jgi:hypothetical protein